MKSEAEAVLPSPRKEKTGKTGKNSSILFFVLVALAGSGSLYAEEIFPAVSVFQAGQSAFSPSNSSGTEIKSSLDWEKGLFSAEISINLAAAGLKLPAGRIRAGEILEDRYRALLRDRLLSIQADSSSTVYDLVERGELALEEPGRVSDEAVKIPPSLSPDFGAIIGRYSIPLGKISSMLSRSGRPGDIPRPLIPAAAPEYTGIIIIADAALPIHGRNSSALLEPCLSPKIWDTEMNLIFDRKMADVSARIEPAPLVVYSPRANIFRPSPSGLDASLAEIAGPNPLRIIAREVYGIIPTDPVIDREDALLIISTENNRRLLRESRVVIIADSSLLVK